MAVTATLSAAFVAADQGVRQGHRQSGLQHRAALAQEQAQKQAMAMSVNEQRKADAAQAEANRKVPDVGSLLAFQQGLPSFGGSARTGAGDADAGRLNLRRPSSTLLGAP